MRGEKRTLLSRNTTSLPRPAASCQGTATSHTFTQHSMPTHLNLDLHVDESAVLLHMLNVLVMLQPQALEHPATQRHHATGKGPTYSQIARSNASDALFLLEALGIALLQGQVLWKKADEGLTESAQAGTHPFIIIVLEPAVKQAQVNTGHQSLSWALTCTGPSSPSSPSASSRNWHNVGQLLGSVPKC